MMKKRYVVAALLALLAAAVLSRGGRSIDGARTVPTLAEQMALDVPPGADARTGLRAGGHRE